MLVLILGTCLEIFAFMSRLIILIEVNIWECVLNVRQKLGIRNGFELENNAFFGTSSSYSPSPVSLEVIELVPSLKHVSLIVRDCLIVAISLQFVYSTLFGASNDAHSHIIIIFTSSWGRLKMPPNRQ